MILHDKAQALVADFPICAISVLRNPGSGLVGLAAPLSFEPIGIALPADAHHFNNLVTNYTHILEGTGLMEALRQKWFSDPAWLQLLPDPQMLPSEVPLTDMTY